MAKDKIEVLKEFNQDGEYLKVQKETNPIHIIGQTNKILFYYEGKQGTAILNYKLEKEQEILEKFENAKSSILNNEKINF